MALTFFEEIIFNDDDMILENLFGTVQDINRQNQDAIIGRTESKITKSEIQRIIIKKEKEKEKIDGIYISNYNLSKIKINNISYTTNNEAKLILFDEEKKINLDIVLESIKEGYSYKQIGCLILLKKIGEMVSLPVDFSFKLKTIGNSLKKSKGGAVRIVYGIKAKYQLGFIGLIPQDIKLLKKIYFFKKYFFMCIFPENDTIHEEGLQHSDFYPLIMSGNFNPKVRNSILGIGQDINITLEEA